MSAKESNPFLPDVEIADEQSSGNSIGNSFNTSTHPIACFFHVSFKAVAIFLYLFGGLFQDPLVQQTVVILLNAMNFYVVKNFSGRYMVGLRWWSVTSDNGLTNTYRFEKTSHPERVGKADSRIFWTFSIANTVVWAFFCLTSVIGLRIRWLVVSVIGVALSGYNLYAYIQAAKDSKTVMSLFTVIPSTITKKAVETIGSAAMAVAKTSLQTSSVSCVYYKPFRVLFNRYKMTEQLNS